MSPDPHAGADRRPCTATDTASSPAPRGSSRPPPPTGAGAASATPPAPHALEPSLSPGHPSPRRRHIKTTGGRRTETRRSPPPRTFRRVTALDARGNVDRRSTTTGKLHTDLQVAAATCVGARLRTTVASALSPADQHFCPTFSANEEDRAPSFVREAWRSSGRAAVLTATTPRPALWVAPWQRRQSGDPSGTGTDAFATTVRVGDGDLLL